MVAFPGAPTRLIVVRQPDDRSSHRDCESPVLTVQVNSTVVQTRNRNRFQDCRPRCTIVRHRSRPSMDHCLGTSAQTVLATVVSMEMSELVIPRRNLLTLVSSLGTERRPGIAGQATVANYLTNAITKQPTSPHVIVYATSDPPVVGYSSPMASIMVAPSRAGLRVTRTPTASSASNLACAVPFPPAIMAPA